MVKWHQLDVARDLDGLLYEKDGPVATITLNRPERGNSMHKGMFGPIRAVWEDVRDDDSIRVVIITGAGDRHFSTGADVGIAASDSSVAANAPLDQTVFWSARHNKVWKPVIAAVNGTVAGGGLHHVVDADIVVASDHVQFLDTHVNIGMVGGLENIGLAKRLPLGTALRMSLQGRDYRLSAERAYQLGLVDELVPPGRALEKAREIALSIAKNSPQAMALTQQAIWGSLEASYEQSLQHAWALIRLQWSHPDFIEGPRAFVEKREPQWNPDPDATHATGA
ncbi:MULTISPECIES: enoyl-CoA hydratase/isomerase family protein [Nocardiaceae]|uniref:Enoyl-CoA hydratase/carnithine racemase n=1 Tax=Rhodococcoides corynebacterioides TaxID=53972 RepID=A0ABS2KZW5_9NOCA|nr:MULTISPECIES: enoyl-CoA hydratase/isomerase family protein [Rhodococcus]MBM7417467.1 enoyl-CoA hydratase/carnithine racemase [Rhodococcus corynebacterioides]MBP1115721.1 enoyl-CoA hydratase/carnithine racemase [Rhodococcus sp. PvP016]